MTIYGYLSGTSEDLESQLAELQRVGCDILSADKLTSCTRLRPRRDYLLRRLTKGDVVVVARLSIVAESIYELLSIISEIHEHDAFLKSLSDDWIDPSGQCHGLAKAMVDGLLEFNKDTIAKRRTRAMHGNSRLSFSDRKDVMARLASGQSVAEIADIFNVSETTIRRACREQDIFS